MNEKVQWGSKVSSCKKYIYNIWCKWSNERPCVFVMLNPSTLKYRYKNYTIDNCITIARDKGCGGMIAVDLFSCIAPTGNELLKKKSKIPNIVGEKNDLCLRSALSKPNSLIIAAWGNISKKDNKFRETDEFKNREHYVSEIIREIAQDKDPKDIKCLKGAQPKREGLTDHPWWLLDDYDNKSSYEIAEEVRKNYDLVDFPL